MLTQIIRNQAQVFLGYGLQRAAAATASDEDAVDSEGPPIFGLGPRDEDEDEQSRPSMSGMYS